ncbi:MAG: aminoacetone oxidase family FAD-binding enzyme [Clostridia bacterium]
MNPCETHTYDLVIIGGGASGMVAALSAKKARPDLSVALLERQARVGRKLLATGNGRCNLTNRAAGDLHHYHGSAYLARTALTRFDPDAVRAFFAQIGLETIPDEAGRYYPLSDQAASVVDVLRLSLDEMGVALWTGFEVKRLDAHPLGAAGTAGAGLGAGFIAHAADGRQVRARRVILCCGGPAGEKLGGSSAGHKLLEALGHPVTPCLAALAQLKTPPDLVRALKGIKLRGTLALLEDGRQVKAECGEVLFADYGLTGIAAMALARRAGEGLQKGRAMSVRMTLLEMSAQSLLLRRDQLPARLLDDFLTGLLPKRLAQTALKLAGIFPLTRAAGTLTPAEAASLSRVLNGWTLPITGTQGFDSAQVTAGGAAGQYFDVDTLESTLVPGLYCAGEVLDVDGDCGGFNLQWAWASGLLAGACAAQTMKEENL